MKTLLIVLVLMNLSACASLVEKCHEFSKYVDIKAIDCADDEPAEKTTEKR